MCEAMEVWVVAHRDRARESAAVSLELEGPIERVRVRVTDVRK